MLLTYGHQDGYHFSLQTAEMEASANLLTAASEAVAFALRATELAEGE